jgi:HEAT repeat protein
MKLRPNRKEFGYGHLKQMERERDVAGLIAALGSTRIQKSKSRRAAVVTSLRKIGASESIPVLSELLQSDSSEAVRRGSAFALGGLDDPAALPALRAALDDESDRVRLWAVRSLGQLRDRASVERLMEMCDDPDGSHRQFAALALGEIGDQRAVPALNSLLDDQGRMVRRQARQALTRLGVDGG